MEVGLPLRPKSKISSSSPDKGSLWRMEVDGGAFGVWKWDGFIIIFIDFKIVLGYKYNVELIPFLYV